MEPITQELRSLIHFSFPFTVSFYYIILLYHSTVSFFGIDIFFLKWWTCQLNGIMWKKKGGGRGWNRRWSMKSVPPGDHPLLHQSFSKSLHVYTYLHTYMLHVSLNDTLHQVVIDSLFSWENDSLLHFSHSNLFKIHSNLFDFLRRC